MQVVGFGPYLGDFKEELLTFRPYIRWLMEILDYDDFYIKSHFNRYFLYKNYVDSEHYIDVYKNLSRDELHQKSIIHKQINQKDFLEMTKSFKKHILEEKKCSKKNITLYYLNYIKNISTYSIYQKIFDRIEDPEDVDLDIEGEYIVFVPDQIMNKTLIENLYNKLVKEFGDKIKVCGDFKTHLTNENIVLHEPDYFENGYKYNIKYMNNAKAVICPCGHWTALANLQQIPVFSWGHNPGQYKGGIYSFDNPKNNIISGDRKSSVEILYKQFNHFLEKLK